MGRSGFLILIIIVLLAIGGYFWLQTPDTAPVPEPPVPVQPVLPPPPLPADAAPADEADAAPADAAEGAADEAPDGDALEEFFDVIPDNE